ncbi:MAG: 2-amino-4-hydroxy-6-hydroxymethyldihydropteridine pyrophosphokinase [Verrucomicrobia bacterium ADurb.Bin345]|nr:MAG: 2-amino-4-hydroxy-6-hydroxymethyldihydropteridine pyrophosphokinase [Verrucomicrobia bacterium ADurb.Bin345]
METGLSLGSNLGDRQANLVDARDRILGLPGTRLLAQSPLYETEPIGVKPEYQQLDFLNAVLILDTQAEVHKWFDWLRAIETEMGRLRSLDRYAPRGIDVDVIYFGSLRIESGGLFVPHRQWKKRRFVLQPLADVRPDLMLPGETRTVRQVLDALPPGEAVNLLTRDW